MEITQHFLLAQPGPESSRKEVMEVTQEGVEKQDYGSSTGDELTPLLLQSHQVAITETISLHRSLVLC